jgi:hypothetical protein
MGYGSSGIRVIRAPQKGVSAPHGEGDAGSDMGR